MRAFGRFLDTCEFEIAEAVGTVLSPLEARTGAERPDIDRPIRRPHVVDTWTVMISVMALTRRGWPAP